MNAKLSSLLLAGTAAVGIAFAGASAFAAPVSFTGECTSTLGSGSHGGGGNGSASGCTIGVTVQSASPNLLINTAASPGNTTGLVTSTAGPATSYESIDDVLVGIVNTTKSTITAVTITGAGIYGFDGDGIDLYANGGVGITPNSKDTSNGGYGGPIGYFTNITSGLSSGVVNFIGGLAPGASTYFSFELPIAGGLCTVPSECHIGGVPEPGSWTLLGSGLIGLFGLFSLGAWRRRRNSASMA